MKMITHDDKLVKQEFTLTTIVIKSVDEQARHAVRLKEGAMPPGACGHEISVRPERSVVARRLGHCSTPEAVGLRPLRQIQLLYSTAGSRALRVLSQAVRGCL